MPTYWKPAVLDEIPVNETRGSLMDPRKMDRLSGVWRTAFGLGIIPLAFIIYWRTFRLRESAVWAAAQTGRNRKRETALLFYHFWHSYAALYPAWPHGGSRSSALRHG